MSRLVKGVSRQVIVVKAPDPRFFEQAIFILKEDAFGRGVTADDVIQEARRVADGYIHHKQKGQRPRQPPLLRHAFASIPGNSVRRQTGGYERQFFPAAGIGILKSGHTGRKQERMCPGW